jgi:WS/DGAT/MGAT family acyltransferase
MAQRHMDRLTAIDASFLHQESPATHMHIGGVATFEGPPPSADELLQHITGRLSLVPRYRQKVVAPPLGLGRQRWVDDPNFRLDYHVRHTALPQPGGDAELRRLTARIFSQSLDRNRPLWELWLVERLEGGRFALINKIHHALVDGVSGVDLLTMLFDVEREPRAVEAEPWYPRPEPTPVALSAATVEGWGERLAKLPVRAAAAAADPGGLLERTRAALEGVAEVAWTTLNSAPETPLNLPITPHRRLEFVSAQLEDFKLVKNAFGATVNDVVLTAVAGGLARFFERRGMPTDDLELHACVPVSTRGSDQHETLGNQITQLVVPLPIYLDDPVERLARVGAEMAGVKESRQALGAEMIAAAQDFAPPTILAQASRLNFSKRLYNLLVTNVPGPQFEIFLLGRLMEGVYPIAFLAGERALAIGVMSYNGTVNFGLIADHDAVPDLGVIATGIERSLVDLVSLARKQTSATVRSRPASPRRRRRPREREHEHATSTSS